IVRDFQKQGCDVEVMMTSAATKFIGPLTFDALTHHDVHVDMFNDPDTPIPHISLSESADIIVIAPCTANIIAKIASGIADDLLSSTVLAATCPVVISPAMNVHMYENPITRRNLADLEKLGITVIDADSGYLACGDVGPGRLPEPQSIVDRVMEILNSGEPKPLSGKKVVITSGPTREAIDPAIYISNRSTGQMGAALAKESLRRGAQTIVVSGPVEVAYPVGTSVVSVESARQMLDAVEKEAQGADIVICAAAVCDFRPENPSEKKLKKGTDDERLSEIDLVPNPDILATLCGEDNSSRIIVGFAAETENVEENGKSKLESKKADMIVANLVGTDEGFASDEDKAILITKSASIDLPRMEKSDLAQKILDKAQELLQDKDSDKA
ncbi:MAG: bifunctional phosphopantothenoylcysteine decarboxylase/phosphopantothenate--cysteine ligase CoaBC, partial [Eggerthellaceae bacterium]|nr:bifunctional phosphopantothenoylcysteine decarboxylase/phosphopantothenate--cysteine ligase CoaBC [Eggerthellaceae bacterium]